MAFALADKETLVGPAHYDTRRAKPLLLPRQVSGIRPEGPSPDGYPAASGSAHPTRGACHQNEPEISRLSLWPTASRSVRRPAGPARSPMGGGKVCAAAGALGTGGPVEGHEVAVAPRQLCGGFPRKGRRGGAPRLSPCGGRRADSAPRWGGAPSRSRAPVGPGRAPVAKACSPVSRSVCRQAVCPTSRREKNDKKS